MKSFNLKKQAAANSPQITDKSIAEHREKMEQSVEKQGVTEKNINLSLPIKNKDNTIPFNKQLDSARKNESEFSIIESQMEKGEFNFGDKTEGVSPINALTQSFCDEKEKAYKKAENEKRDTAFWDKYVGVQMESEVTKVKKNIPGAASQLQNNPNRFKGKDITKMVMASLKDADALLFHIYATAEKEKRELNDTEKQQINDINSNKIRILSEDYSKKTESPIIKQDRDGMVRVYEKDGSCIDEFKDVKEAQANYPEGEINNA
jgi:hypothetical protein